MLNRDDPAIGHWPTILAPNLTPAQLSGRQAPCPICLTGTDRFRFDNKDGRGTWFCNRCGAGDGYRLVMALTGQTFKQVADIMRRDFGGAPRAAPAVRERDHRKQLNELWAGSLPDHTDMDAYFASRDLPPTRDPVLRYHPACPWRSGEYSGRAPAMLARIFQDGKPVTLHRTFLTSDVPVRKMIMPHNGKLSGCYIPLGGKARRIGVAEGIETALSATALSSDKLPVWATYCASQLERFVPPDDIIASVLIFGDNDRTFTGQASAYLLAKRMVAIQKSCSVLIPSVPGDDWNDVLVGRNHEASEGI